MLSIVSEILVTTSRNDIRSFPVTIFPRRFTNDADIT